MSKNHYVYYSYEQWGRGYIGRRTCSCLPEEDVEYFGSFKDKAFKPTEKVILEVFETSEGADQAEIALHKFFKVDENPEFANMAIQGCRPRYTHPKGTKCYNNGYHNKLIRPGEIVSDGYSLGAMPTGYKETSEYSEWCLKRSQKTINKMVERSKSKEAVAKRKKTLEDICHQSGDKNSQFGTMWITDGTLNGNRKVPRNSALPEGFKLGRTMEDPLLTQKRREEKEKKKKSLKCLIERRLSLLNQVDLTTYGWVEKASRILELSHTQARSFVDKYYEGIVFRRRSRSKLN
jgi:hypothetical protein